LGLFGSGIVNPEMTSRAVFVQKSVATLEPPSAWCRDAVAIGSQSWSESRVDPALPDGNAFAH